MIAEMALSEEQQKELDHQDRLKRIEDSFDRKTTKDYLSIFQEKVFPIIDQWLNNEPDIVKRNSYKRMFFNTISSLLDPSVKESEPLLMKDAEAILTIIREELAELLECPASSIAYYVVYKER